MKAETNLTDESWTAWQISLGEGTTLVADPEGRHNMCQQYQKLYVSEARDRFCFFEGDIRPGEPILKQFTLDTKIPRIVMSHNRVTRMLTEPAEGSVPEEVRNGFQPKPIVESWVTGRRLA